MFRFQCFALVLCAAFSGTSANAMPHRRMRGRTAKAPREDAVLPQVEFVMQSAHDALKNVTANAHRLQDFVADHQHKAKEALQMEKVKLEARLMDQAKVNAQEWSKNKQVRLGLKASYDRAAKFRRQNKAIQNSSEILRDAIAAMSTRVDLATEFLDQVNTEVGKLSPEELEALHPSPPALNMDYYLVQERSKLTKEMSTPAVFLQLSSEPTAVKLYSEEEDAVMSAQQAVTLKMKDTFGKLNEANQHALDMLHQRFSERNATQANRLAMLLESTGRLNESWTNATATVDNLIAAKAHLSSTNKDLVHRLHGMQAFYRQIILAMDKSLEQANMASYDVRP